jgi:hypothetical protein
VHARQLLARHGKHTKRVVLPKVILDREWKAREVGPIAQIIGVDARRIELLAASSRYLQADEL